MATQNQKPQGLPNPYGSLPNPYALPTVAEAAPVKFTEEQAKPEEKKSTAKLFHNPHLIKRPQAKVNSTVKKPAAPKTQMSSSSSDAPTNFQQPSLEYFRSTADDDAAIIEARREERREQQRRKKDDKKFRKMFGDWRGEQHYKLRHGTKIDAYRASGSYRDKLDEFQSFLQATRDVPSPRHSSDDASEPRRTSYSRSNSPAVVANPMFAPPSFDEPPVSLSAPSMPSPPADIPIAEPRASETTPSVPKKSNPTSAAQTTDDTFANRLLLAKQKALALAAAIPPPPPPPPKAEEAVPPPPPTAAYNPTISAEPVRYNATISAAPIRYDVPISNTKDVDNEASERPAKKQKKEAPKSKAALMMAKMGYVKGQGLGKNSDGVTTHLEVKKRKDQGSRQPQEEFDGEGKRIKAQQVFDITGGLRKEPKDHGPFGEPSRVIVTWGCVDNVDFSTDADRDDGGIRQELGDIFNTKFGVVERIHVNMQSDQTPVYIAFKDPLCALNAVNRFHEGYEVRGNTIKAHFYDELKFSSLEYDH